MAKDRFGMWDYSKQYEDQGFYIPARMMPGLERYVNEGIVPGQFLHAVITNDLQKAVAHADHENVMNLPAYVRFLYNHMPSPCWGSQAKVKAWVQQNNDRRKQETIASQTKDGE